MIRLSLLIGIVMGWIVGAPSHAAPSWRWSNPAPHGAHIFTLASNGNTVVQAGEFGQAYASDDLITWRPLATTVTNMLRASVWFGGKFIITGESGLIVYSDTLEYFHTIDLGTSDWLEGVATSGTRLVAVGDNGAVYTSSEGTNWQRQPNAAEWLHSVAYGNGLFVAVGDAGFVMRSPDGLTWNTSGGRLGNQDLNRVTWSGGRFWALGNLGAAFSSVNGSNWSPLNVQTTNDLFSASCNGTQAVIVGRSTLITSLPPYDTWTSQTGDSPAPPTMWTYYSSIFDGAEFLVGGRSGMFVEGFQPTNSTSYVWLSDSESPRNWMWSMQRIGGIYAACGEQGGIFTSLDGFRFDQEAIPSTAATEILEGIGGTTNLLIAVGTSGVVLTSPGGHTNVVSTNSTGQVVTNDVNLLGLVWNEIVPRPTTNELQGVGVFGNSFIITGGQGTILTSADARTWIPRISNVAVMLSSVAASDSRVVVAGDLGTILTSEEAVLWTKRSSGVTNWVYQVRYLNGLFVAVGEAGLILTSPDGLTWTRQNSGATAWLNGVTYESGNYYIAGSQGVMLQSPDAVTWTQLPVPTGKSLYDVAGENGWVVAAGIEGAALRSHLVPWTTPVNFLGFNIHTNTQAFLFSGQLDQQFKIQKSPDLRRWIDMAPMEILDNSGTTIFYDALLNGAQWFFRTVLTP